MTAYYDNMKNVNKNTYKNILITSIITAILITSGINMAYADGVFPGKNTFGSTTNVASGYQSAAFGFDTTASGEYATTFGVYTTSTGHYSAAFGSYTTAQPFDAFVIGRFNEISGTTNSWIDTEPLFVIGNGADAGNPNNAVTVLKNGNVGIGISAPTQPLQVAGIIESTLGGFKFPDGTTQTTASNGELVDGSVTTSKIANNAITSSKMAIDAVTNGKIAANVVTERELADAAVTSSKIEDNAVTRNKILDGEVTTTEIAVGAVTTDKIADAAVTSSKMAIDAVTNGKIAANVVTERELADAAVTSSKIEDNAVTRNKILDGEVTTTEIAVGAVTTDKIADAAVTSSKIEDNAVTLSKISSPTLGGLACDTDQIAKWTGAQWECDSLQFDMTSGMPTTDCVDTDDLGRMKIDDSVKKFYICANGYDINQAQTMISWKTGILK